MRYNTTCERIASLSECFPATAVNRSLQSPGDQRRYTMIQPNLVHFLPPRAVQVLSPSTSMARMSICWIIHSNIYAPHRDIYFAMYVEVR